MSKQTDKIILAIGQLEGKVDGINDRLDKQNGTILRHQEKIENNKETIDRSVGKSSAYSFLIAIGVSLAGLILTYLRIK